MDRRAIILAGLDLSHSRGLEIGPLSKPLISKCDSKVLYVDHASTSDLRQKYKENTFYNEADFAEIDVVWAGKQLRELIPPEFEADYIVASHVIEHVPDLIRWLEQLQSILSSKGEIRLAIPDKRFIFDHYRQVTRLSEILAAWVRRETIPNAQAIIDYRINAVGLTAADFWRGRAAPYHLASPEVIQEAVKIAGLAINLGTYEDAHCWVFSPASFADIMGELVSLGYLNFKCNRIVDTPDFGMEFYVDIGTCTDPQVAKNSWTAALSSVRRDQVFEPEARELRGGKVKGRAYSELATSIRRLIACSKLDPVFTDIPYFPRHDFAITPELLEGLLWRYSRFKSSDLPTALQLISNGEVSLYEHPNESRWEIREGNLCFFHVDGRQSVHFDQILNLDGRIALRGRFILHSEAEIIMTLEEWGGKSEPPTQVTLTHATRDHFRREITSLGWTIGEHTYGSPAIFEHEFARLHIGRFCSIAEGVKIVLGNHRVDFVSSYPFATLRDRWTAAPHVLDHSTKGDIIIGNDVWIGTAAVILSGVNIGDGAVIGANAVVTHDIPPYAIVAGNPAQVIRFRFSNDVIDQLKAIAWWDWTDEKLNRHLDLILSTNPRPFIAAAQVSSL